MQNDPSFKQTSSQKPAPYLNHSSSTQNRIESMYFNPFSGRIQQIRPMIRKGLPNSPKGRAKLRINGNKYFSKISAAGPHTFQILQNIKKSSTFKMIHKFEFDPYLCDYSYLTQLKLVLKKLKTVKQFSLIIRRIDNDSREINNLKIIGSSLSKLLRLQKIKLEFPSTLNLDEPHVLTIYSSIKKCYLLKSFEWILIENSPDNFTVPSRLENRKPEMSTDEQYHRIFVILMRNLRKLEHYKEYVSIRNERVHSGLQEIQKSSNFPKMSTKHIEIMYSMAKEWSHMGESGDLRKERVLQYLRYHTRLESFKLQLIKSPVVSQDILEFLKCFASLKNFRHLEYEFLNCGIGDMEITVFAYGFSQIPQLQYLGFKIIQSSPISLEYIEMFVEKISNMRNIEKFDFYFRKQYISRRDVSQIENRFSRFKNVQCSCSPQSLYIYKIQP